MKIADSNISLESRRKFQAMGKSTGKQTGSASFSSVTDSLSAKRRDAYYSSEEYAGSTYSYTNTGQGFRYGSAFGEKEFDVEAATLGTKSQVPQGISSMQIDLLSLLMKRFSGSGAYGVAGQMYSFQSSPTTLTERFVNYQEYEDTQFQAQGQAVTEDGRRIDFDIHIAMSRSYLEYTDMHVPMVSSALMDPLVVNVGADVAQVSDQTFRFDLDADGVEEEVSMLGKGSGFLALDLNEDGRINDGSELFGTRSGDGFSDLRKYDSDGNGWIDENDEVFEKLRIWCKNGDGEDVLLNLKEADIGAIFLGNAATEFSIDGAFGTSAVVRSTGVFLKESGGAGTVQHVDLATYLPKDLAQVAGTDRAVRTEEGAGILRQVQTVSQTISVMQTGSGSQAGSTSQAYFQRSSTKREEKDDQPRWTDEKAALRASRQQIRRERARLAEAMAKRQAEKKRVAKELAEQRFVKKQSMEDAQIEKLFEERELRQEFYEEKAFV